MICLFVHDFFDFKLNFQTKKLNQNLFDFKFFLSNFVVKKNFWRISFCIENICKIILIINAR